MIHFVILINILVKEKDILGGDMVIQYLLWMLKPSDFGQMDPGLIIWLTKKMIDFKFIGIYVEYCKYPVVLNILCIHFPGTQFKISTFVLSVEKS